MNDNVISVRESNEKYDQSNTRSVSGRLETPNRKTSIFQLSIGID